jgi:hypothetical protein
VESQQLAAAVLSLLLGQASADAQLIPLSTPLAQAGYRQVSTQQGVAVFKHSSSGDLRYAAEGLFDASPARLMAALLDYDRQARIMPRLAKSQILAHGPRWLVVYQRLKLPVVNDRDYVLRVTWGHDAGTVWLRYQATDQAGPPKRWGVVRVQRHQGGWQFRQDSQGKTLARYEVMLDLAGWVPRWMVRSQTVKELAATFRNLRQLTAPSTTSR